MNIDQVKKEKETRRNCRITKSLRIVEGSSTDRYPDAEE